MEENKLLLFSDIKFIVAQCYNAEGIKNLLIEGGAKHINYLSEHVTLVIADANCPEVEEAVELFDKPVVSSLWVHLSLKAKNLLPKEAFSPLKSIFHNVIASFSADLTKNDVDSLASTLTFYGSRVRKHAAASTHFIVASSNPSDPPANSHNLKIVAPDWVLESVRQKKCCDEQLYDPSLLLPPPPPTPPPPVISEPIPQQQPDPQPHLTKQLQQQAQQHHQPAPTLPSSSNQEVSSARQGIPEATRDERMKTDDSLSSQHHVLQQSQTSQPQHHVHTMPTSQLPRPRMPSNIIRGAQPRFRPLLPPNNSVQIVAPTHQLNATPVDSQQPKKVTIYGQHRKISPYQNNIEHQQHHPIQQSQQLYQKAQPQHFSIQQQQSGIVQQSRLPQPNMFHQVRGAYQNSHMPPRGPSQQPPMANSPQQQQQLAQGINRFQDPTMHGDQRPYQVCLQPQAVNQNYQQNVHRQPVYYAQSANNQVRMAQQGPPIRHVQNESNVYDSYNQTHPQPDSLSSPSVNQPPQRHQHYQTQPQVQQPPQSQPTPQPHSSQPFSQQTQQMQSLQPQQPQLPIVQMRPQFQSNFPPVGPSGHNVRAIRKPFSNQQEQHSKPNVVRLPNVSQVVSNSPGIGARGPNNAQPTPHPSVFDHIESNLAQIKAKVPIVTESVNYYGHDPQENVPKDKPLAGCRFRFVEYEDINPKLKLNWFEAIKAAGGTFVDKLEKSTHLICESRATQSFSGATKLNIRCVTIYWVNDVLANDRLSYPWKALHLPVPFTKTNKPLSAHIIAITNFKGKVRQEVKEMIMKAGARYTEYFSPNNTLIICGNVGGDKYERAVEWKVPIANCHVLSDILLNPQKDLDTMLTQAKYQLFSHDDPLKLNSYAEIHDLMQPWTKPIALSNSEVFTTNGTMKGSKNIPTTNEDSGIATGGSNNSELDTSNGKTEVVETSSTATNGQTAENVSEDSNRDCTALTQPTTLDCEIPNNQEEQQSKTDAPTIIGLKDSKPSVAPDSNDSDPNECKLGSDEKKENFEALRASKEISSKGVPEGKSLEQNQFPRRKSNEPIRVIFTHLESTLADQLKLFATELGLNFASNPISCTHLVVDRISRTPKFICAFSHASYIMSYKWIVESHRANHLLDEKPFILQDKEGEEKYSFSLVYSLLKRKKRSGLLFNNFVFFVTPSVIFDVTNLKEMIESAGGFVATKKPPTKLQLDQMKSSGKRLVVVTCAQDYHLCSTLESYGVDIVSAEFVISGILRQDIDFPAHSLKPPRALFVRPGTTSLPQISQASPPKKIRLEDSSC